MPMILMVVGRWEGSITPKMVSFTILWSGGQMTRTDAAAPPHMSPPLELLVLELLVLELLLLELLVPEPLLLNSVPASMTREPSDATAASVPAPSSAYASFDIGFPSRSCRP